MHIVVIVMAIVGNELRIMNADHFLEIVEIRMVVIGDHMELLIGIKGMIDGFSMHSLVVSIDQWIDVFGLNEDGVVENGMRELRIDHYHSISQECCGMISIVIEVLIIVMAGLEVVLIERGMVMMRYLNIFVKVRVEIIIIV